MNSKLLEHLLTQEMRNLFAVVRYIRFTRTWAEDRPRKGKVAALYRKLGNRRGWGTIRHTETHYQRARPLGASYADGYEADVPHEGVWDEVTLCDAWQVPLVGVADVPVGPGGKVTFRPEDFGFVVLD